MIAAMTRAVHAGVTPFEEVYREHADAVYRFCVSQLRDQATAEDVTGDVFAAAFHGKRPVRSRRGLGAVDKQAARSGD